MNKIDQLDNEVFDLDDYFLRWIYIRLLYFKNFYGYGFGTPPGCDREEYEEIIDEMIRGFRPVIKVTPRDEDKELKRALELFKEYLHTLWV